MLPLRKNEILRFAALTQDDAIGGTQKLRTFYPRPSSSSCGRREKGTLSLFRWLSTADTRFCVGDDVLDVPRQPRSPTEIPFVRSNSRTFVILSELFYSESKDLLFNRTNPRKTTFVRVKFRASLPHSGREVARAERVTKGARERNALCKIRNLLLKENLRRLLQSPSVTAPSRREPLCYPCALGREQVPALRLLLRKVFAPLFFKKRRKPKESFADYCKISFLC